MLGVVAPPPEVLAGEAPQFTAVRESATALRGARGADDEPVALPKRALGKWVALFGLILLLLAGGAAVTWAVLAGGEVTNLEARLVPSPEGEVLIVRIPGDGVAKVRLLAMEQPVTGGEARFTLPTTALNVGTNEIPVELFDADGDIRSVKVSLTVSFRVRPDTAGLLQREPFVTVVVDAVPGSTVTIAGEALVLDARGRGERRFPVPPRDSNDAFELEVPYVVTLPSDEPSEGRAVVRLPAAAITVARPGRRAFVEEDHVSIEATVSSDSVVTVDGAPAAVEAGRLTHRVPLPAEGVHRPEIVVRAPGRAPRTRTIEVHRVASLTAAAAAFDADRSVTYQVLKTDPPALRGRRVALSGRIYNLSRAREGTDLQILVEGCPRGEQCPLWVHYPAALDVEKDQSVRVLGEVTGWQQFRAAASGEVVQVPAVEAVFVLPPEAR
jgi:hypothetical protein